MLRKKKFQESLLVKTDGQLANIEQLVSYNMLFHTNMSYLIVDVAKTFLI